MWLGLPPASVQESTKPDSVVFIAKSDTDHRTNDESCLRPPRHWAQRLKLCWLQQGISEWRHSTFTLFPGSWCFSCVLLIKPATRNACNFTSSLQVASQSTTYTSFRDRFPAFCFSNLEDSGEKNCGWVAASSVWFGRSSHNQPFLWDWFEGHDMWRVDDQSVIIMCRATTLTCIVCLVFFHR